MATSCDRHGYGEALAGFDFNMNNTDEQLYYSIWQGQRLKFICNKENPDEARNDFVAILEVAKNNGVGAMYECRFHTKRPTSALNNKSDYSGSFTFVVNEYNGGRNNSAVQVQQVQQNSGSSIQQLVNDIQALQQLQSLLFPGMPAGGAVGSDVEPPKTIWDRVDNLLTTPVIEELILAGARKMGLDTTAQHNANMNGDTTEQVTLTDEEQQQVDDDTARLQNVLRRLAYKEPNYISLLEKIADLKEKNPLKYNMAKSML